MFCALVRRLVSVFAVVFGMLAFSAVANAQNLSPMDSGIRYQDQKKVQVHAQKSRVHKRKVYLRYQVRGKRFAHAGRTARHAHVRPHRKFAPVARSHQPTLVTAKSSGPVVARVDIKSQRMTVSVGGDVVAVWHVSTGRKGYVTPRGVYGPQRMHVKYFSKKYYNAPMPYAIFFKGGYAVHGTGAVKALGAPASHGCIRLATGNARALFQLVKQFGPGKARIVIT